MAERVSPDEARRGECIDTFDFSQRADALRAVDNLERMMRHLVNYNQTTPRRVVYAFVPDASGIARFGTWQIYLMP